MNMKTIKAKERTGEYNLKYLTYKEGKRIILNISYPNKYNNYLFRVRGRGWCYSDIKSLQDAKESAERFLNSYYSILGGCKIIYL